METSVQMSADSSEQQRRWIEGNDMMVYRHFMTSIRVFVSDTTQMIIQATGVLHNIAIQRKQLVPSENYLKIAKNSADNQSNDNGKQKYFTESYNAAGLADRDNFIAKYFSLE